MAISLAVDSQQKSTMAVLSNNCNVTLKWIPVKFGNPGNKQAYTMAKQGAQTEQPVANVSYQEKTIITKALIMPSQEKHAYNLLSIPEQVMMMRLRTGNNQWNAHMHKMLNTIPSEACLFGEED